MFCFLYRGPMHDATAPATAKTTQKGIHPRQQLTTNKHYVASYKLITSTTTTPTLTPRPLPFPIPMSVPTPTPTPIVMLPLFLILILFLLLLPVFLLFSRFPDNF